MPKDGLKRLAVEVDGNDLADIQEHCATRYALTSATDAIRWSMRQAAGKIREDRAAEIERATFHQAKLARATAAIERRADALARQERQRLKEERRAELEEKKQAQREAEYQKKVREREAAENGTALSPLQEAAVETYRKRLGVPDSAWATMPANSRQAIEDAALKPAGTDGGDKL